MDRQINMDIDINIEVKCLPFKLILLMSGALYKQDFAPSNSDDDSQD